MKPLFIKSNRSALYLYPLFILLFVTLSVGAVEIDKETQFNISPQKLSSALLAFSDQSEFQVVVSNKTIEGMDTRGISGNLTPRKALESLLEGTGLSYDTVAGNTITITGKTASGKSQPASNKILIAQAGTSAQKAGTTAALKGRNEKENESSGIIEEIIVTSQKREQKLIDVPMSITALDDEALKARGIDDILDLSFAVPGLAAIERGPGTLQYTIRGIGNQNGSSALVGVYLDEAAVTSDPLRQVELRAMDLERVEVLRGPQGTLYGAGSAGGTIRFITKDPELEQFAGDAKVATYFTESGEQSVEGTAVVNMPVVEDVFGLRLAATYENTGGWTDQPATGTEDINDQEMFNIRIKGLWRPTNELEIKGMVNVHRRDGDWNNDADNDGNFISAIDRTSPPLPIEDNYELYNLTVSYDFDSVRLLSTSTYLDNFKDVPFSVVGTAFEFEGTNIIDAKIFTQEVRLNSQNDGPLSWTAGVFYEDKKIENPLTFDFLTGGTLFPNLGSIVVDDNQAWAVFGEASYVFAGRLEIGAGLRYFEDEREFFDGTTTQEGSFDALSPRGFASYEIMEGVKVYGSIGEGFRSGGFNVGGQAPYQPESIVSYEAGVKMVLLNRRLNTDIAFFYVDYEDVLFRGLLSLTNPVNIISNVGQAEVKGIDWSLNWLASDNLTFSISGNITDSEITEISSLASSHIVGDPLDYVPEYNFSISANYLFNWQSLPGFVHVDYNQQGEMHVTNRATNSLGTSDKLDFLNLRIGLELNSWEFTLIGRNLLNEEGKQGPFSDDSATRAQPRTIGVQVGYAFD